MFFYPICLHCYHFVFLDESFFFDFSSLFATSVCFLYSYLNSFRPCWCRPYHSPLQNLFSIFLSHLSSDTPSPHWNLFSIFVCPFPNPLFYHFCLQNFLSPDPCSFVYYFLSFFLILVLIIVLFVSSSLSCSDSPLSFLFSPFQTFSSFPFILLSSFILIFLGWLLSNFHLSCFPFYPAWHNSLVFLLSHSLFLHFNLWSSSFSEFVMSIDFSSSFDNLDPSFCIALVDLDGTETACEDTTYILPGWMTNKKMGLNYRRMKRSRDITNSENEEDQRLKWRNKEWESKKTKLLCQAG